jgi:probable F420-dependent oxidoreductase
MKFTLSIAMNPLDQLGELAQAAEEAGFASIALPDSLFYAETVSTDYPYTPDGSRFWTADTPWVDPLVATAAMGAVTSRIEFYTSVLKLGSRNPVLLARQVGLGLGVGWLPQEFEYCGVPFERRGKRVDEAIDVLRLILDGGMVEYHGEFYDFDKIQMSPAPPKRVPFYIGGHTDVALRRAARVADGWSSAMMKLDELRDTIARLKELLAERGRADDPFEYQAVCIDKFGLDGYREQAEAGVTDVITMPWVFDGVGFDAPVEPKLESIHKFGAEIIAKFEE